MLPTSRSIDCEPIPHLFPHFLLYNDLYDPKKINFIAFKASFALYIFYKTSGRL